MPVPSDARPPPLRLRLPERALALPAECACCGEAASVQSALGTPNGGRLLVGYCDACAAHGARTGTRQLAAWLGSCLVGLTLAAGLPLVLPELGVLACVLITLFGALLPLAPARLRGGAPEGHAAWGKAVFFDRDAELVCLRQSYAQKLADALGVTATEAPAPRRAPFELLVPLGCALLAAHFHGDTHPRLRVINANTESIEVFIDGESLGRIEPSGAESPAAGLSTRIAAGRRRLRAVTASGRVLSDTPVSASAGSDHLFAPGAPETCFWLERAAYGRARGDFERSLLVPSRERFWTIPDSVQGWFVPLPPTVERARTTGGTVTVLRQGACAGR